MLDELYTGNLSISSEGLPLQRYHWDVLLKLWNQHPEWQSVKFTTNGFQWQIEEFIDSNKTFDMTRSVMTRQRSTNKDCYGLLGLSLINPQDQSVILTEGVSDYMTAKLLCPNRNVLGVTTLGGSAAAKKILVNLFSEFLFCADSDVTGIKNVNNWKQFLSKFGKHVNIFTPPSSFKDITEAFIFNLKLAL